MFEALSDRFDGIFARIKGKGKLREEDVDETLREIRLALLEADVNFQVVKNLVSRIRERVVGIEVSQALNPAQQVIKIVNEELIESLGGETVKLTYASKPPTVVLMAGLQGSGKTTTSAKLARWFKAQGRNPLLVGADLQRPAAVQQLRTLAGQVGVPVFSAPDDVVASGTGDPVEVAKACIGEARRLGKDVVIVDTAGRLAIDAELMEQVRQISEATSPDHTFLVVDAMTGQDAVTVAESFNDTLALDGVILTKLDGDARGGAALSVKEVVGKPIAFASTGEKLDDFDLFHPDRLAGRILGMGDVLTLIEKAEQVYEEKEAEAAAQKLMEGQFTFDDFLDQMAQIKKMGSISSLLGMMPGIPKEVKNVNIDDKELNRIEGIIHSMTRAERNDPTIIDGSRRARIAAGSGSDVGAVSQLVKQFLEMQKMIKSMPGMGNRMAKRKKKKAKKGGGRVTPKGGTTAPASKKAFTLPGLDQ
ncbi:MAG TPA: signal recognition particle protein [Acidimicrobiales bacterium]|nr:signal recognition particle protein [Acidimicrobiales bacterium]